MRILAVIDHPWTGSFNHAIFSTLVRAARLAGHKVDELDLHHERFDPVMRVEELAVYSSGRYLDPKVGDYQKRIEKAEYLFLVFPVWWETMPAMLKGFFDKVFLPDWAFSELDASPRLGHILGATVITTMGAPAAIHTAVEPALCRGTLGMVGVRRCEWLNFTDVGRSDPGTRAAWLARVAEAGRNPRAGNRA